MDIGTKVQSGVPRKSRLLAPFGSDAYSQGRLFWARCLGGCRLVQAGSRVFGSIQAVSKTMWVMQIDTSLGSSLLQTVNDLHWLVCVWIFFWSYVASCCEFIALSKVPRSLLMPASWHLQRLPKKGFHHQHSQILASQGCYLCNWYVSELSVPNVLHSSDAGSCTHQTGCILPEITTLCRLKMSFTDSATCWWTCHGQSSSGAGTNISGQTAYLLINGLK